LGGRAAGTMSVAVVGGTAGGGGTDGAEGVAMDDEAAVIQHSLSGARVKPGGREVS